MKIKDKLKLKGDYVTRLINVCVCENQFVLGLINRVSILHKSVVRT